MTILESWITDVNFSKDISADQKATYLADGQLRFESLCTQYAVDNSQIPDNPPYIPKRIGILCVLIAMCADLAGTSWQVVSDGFSLDTYKQKHDFLEDELTNILVNFYPDSGLLGYTTDDSDDVTTSAANPIIYRG